MKRLKSGSRWMVFAAVLVLLLGMTALVHASFIYVDTNDGVIDSAWSGAVTQTDTDGDNLGPDSVDIRQAWIATDAASPAEFFFRLKVGAAPDDTGNYVFLLDCNDNSSFTDSVDVIVIYTYETYTGETIDVLSGDRMSGNTYGGALGEYVGSDIEWKMTDGEPLMAACMASTGRIGVRAETWYIGGGDLPDQTVEFSIYVPTAANVIDLKTQQQRTFWYASALFLTGMLMAFAAWKMRR